jgi:hypothetical protein
MESVELGICNMMIFDGGLLYGDCRFKSLEVMEQGICCLFIYSVRQC